MVEGSRSVGRSHLVDEVADSILKCRCDGRRCAGIGDLRQLAIGVFKSCNSAKGIRHRYNLIGLSGMVCNQRLLANGIRNLCHSEVRIIGELERLSLRINQLRQEYLPRVDLPDSGSKEVA